MGIPSIQELPPPPSGRTGWPWTEAGPPIPARRGLLPTVSIVTPSFNQGRFIEEAIRSVLLQGYPDLEYIVIDGGSTDETVDIIRKYEPWLAYWVSERDGGQTNAINKGFERARGVVLAWLNSDDYYLPGAISEASRQLAAAPRPGMVYAGARAVGEEGKFLWKWRPPRFSFRTALVADYIPQPSAFFRTSIFREVGMLDERFRF